MPPCRRPPHVAWCCCLLAAVAGAARAAGPADKALRSPTADRIPIAEMHAAIDSAVAAGVASVMARIMAEGNESGLAYPPRVARKEIGKKTVPARRVPYEEPVYEVEYAEVEQLVPETSAGQPTKPMCCGGKQPGGFASPGLPTSPSRNTCSRLPAALDG